MKPVTYKLILDNDGALEALELCQGQRSITISLAVHGTHRSGYRWSEIKEVVDRLQARAKAEALTVAGAVPTLEALVKRRAAAITDKVKVGVSDE